MDKLKKFYKNKIVLVTGATGFKGAWLCSWLLILGAKVIGTGFNPNKNRNLFYKLNLHKKIKLKVFDIRDFKKIEALVKKNKPEIIFHLAAQPLIYESYVKPHLTFDVNIRGTLNILEITKKFNFIKSSIFVTSDKCYENSNSTKGFLETDRLGGKDPYSASKASAELLIRSYRDSFFQNKKKRGISSGRAGNVIGGGDWSEKRLIPDSIRSIMKNKVILIRNPNFNRPWQFVMEPLKGYLILAMKQFKKPFKYSSAWNFGTEPRSITSVKVIVEKIINFWGKGKIKVLNKKRFYEQVNLQLNIKKAKKRLGWSPTYSISQSVEVTTDWYYQVLHLKRNPEEVTNQQITDYMNEN